MSLPRVLAVAALANPVASPKLWATVNVCDIASAPDTIGVRAPASGSTMLRGNVTFEWRRGTRIVYQGQKLTEAGHADAAQADPPGSSAAACEIKP